MQNTHAAIFFLHSVAVAEWTSHRRESVQDFEGANFECSYVACASIVGCSESLCQFTFFSYLSSSRMLFFLRLAAGGQGFFLFNFLRFWSNLRCLMRKAGSCPRDLFLHMQQH